MNSVPKWSHRGALAHSQSMKMHPPPSQPGFHDDLSTEAEQRQARKGRAGWAGSRMAHAGAPPSPLALCVPSQGCSSLAPKCPPRQPLILVLLQLLSHPPLLPGRPRTTVGGNEPEEAPSVLGVGGGGRPFPSLLYMRLCGGGRGGTSSLGGSFLGGFLDLGLPPHPGTFLPASSLGVEWVGLIWP